MSSNFNRACGLSAILFLAHSGAVAVGQASSSSSPPPVGGAVQPPTLGDQQAHPSTVTCKPARSGHVTVRVHVSEAGEPSNEAVATSSGDPCLDQKAVEAVRSYHFKPAMKDGHAVSVDLFIDINMQIKGKDEKVGTPGSVSIPEEK